MIRYLLLTYLLAGLGAAETIYSSDFERDAADQAPLEVRDESGWAGGKATLIVRDSGDPERGKVLEAQVEAFAQICWPLKDLDPTKTYRVSALITARGIQKIKLGLRQGPPPYHMTGAKSAQVFESPRRISFVVRNPKPHKSVRAQITMDGHTTLTIDDVLIERLDENEAAEEYGAEMLPDPVWPRGNQLANSSFEAGTDGWHRRGQHEVVRVDDAPHGRHVLRIEKSLISSPWIDLPLRSQTLLRVRARAVTGTAKLTFGFGDYVNFRGGTDGKRTTMHLKAEDGWTTGTLLWTPKTPDEQVAPTKPFIAELNAGGGVVEVDAVEVRFLAAEGEPEEQGYAPRSAHEFAVHTDAPFGVARVDDQITARVLSASPEDSGTLYVLDETGAIHAAHPFTASNGEASIDLGALPLGAWRLTTAEHGDAAHAGIDVPAVIHGETFCSVVPTMPEVPLERWPFGSHIRPVPELIEACWRLGWRWNRLHDTWPLAKWAVVERDGRESWNFDPKLFERQRASGHALMANIDGIPAWAPRSGGTGPERSGKATHGLADMDDDTARELQRYCERLVRTGGDLFDEYEITNEPNLSGMKPEHYNKILAAAAAGLRAADPKVKIVGLGGVVAQDSSWFYECIRLGAGAHCDAVSFHGYGFTPNGQQNGPEPMIRIVAKAREALAASGYPNHRVYDTESGFIVRSAHTKHNAPLGRADSAHVAATLPKAVAGVIAGGLDRWYYYAAFLQRHAGEGAAYAVCEPDDVIKPAHQPMAVAIAQLVGRTYLGRVTREDEVVHLRFSGDGADEVHMLWHNAGERAIPMPAGTTSVTAYHGRPLPVGDTLTLAKEPVYLRVAIEND
ncbi:MAG: hypothetical protein PF961_16065 [Planctomycetota bacterium]|jgi:hypothetical protein|nr:hypothetical protein [Planctomycetota bacterium]